MKPNLFALATKELSQDAFLAWLLQWADPGCREHNAALNDVAGEFVNRLIALQGTAPAVLTHVKVRRQREHIDVWAEVNDSHLIVIEDKVSTREHSNQLFIYREKGQKWCTEHGCELICIYIKTHSDSATNFKGIEKQGFSVYSRRQLLELLNAHEAESDIYNDFRDRLRMLEGSESEFTEKKIGSWIPADWKGFYQRLQETREVENWFWVNPPGGNGFWSLILGAQRRDGFPLYLQIEQGHLCFRVGNVKVASDRRRIRGEFHHFLMKAGGAEIGLLRPKFGSGSSMKVALIPRTVWLGADDDLLDLNAVLARLNDYETWLAGIIAATQPATATN